MAAPGAIPMTTVPPAGASNNMGESMLPTPATQGGAHRKIHRGLSAWRVQDKYSGEHTAELRNGFLRKVYGILTLQLAITTFVCYECMYFDPLTKFVLAHPGLMIVGLIASLFVLFGIFKYKNDYPTNYYLLLAFTLCEAYTIGVVCALYKVSGKGELVLQAFGLTLAIFSMLTLFVMQSKINFDFMGAALFSCLMLMIGWSVVNMLFGFHRTWVFSLLGAMLFCGFILFDTWRIINVYGYDDYVVAALELYLDIINLFLYILELLDSQNE